MPDNNNELNPKAPIAVGVANASVGVSNVAARARDRSGLLTPTPPSRIAPEYDGTGSSSDVESRSSKPAIASSISAASSAVRVSVPP